MHVPNLLVQTVGDRGHRVGSRCYDYSMTKLSKTKDTWTRQQRWAQVCLLMAFTMSMAMIWTALYDDAREDLIWYGDVGEDTLPGDTIGSVTHHLFDSIVEAIDSSPDALQYYSNYISPTWSTSDVAYRDSRCVAHHVVSKLLPDIVYLAFEDIVPRYRYQWSREFLTNGTISKAVDTPLIDVVITWVNGSEPEFQKYKSQFESQSPLEDKWRVEAVNRHRDFDELRYLFRSLKNLDNLQNVQIVSTRRGSSSVQTPTWLNDTCNRNVYAYHFIAQEDLYLGSTAYHCLPIFSSPAVETLLPNLPHTNADAFLLLNDDMALGKRHTPADVDSLIYGTPFAFDTELKVWGEINQVERPNASPSDWIGGEIPYLLLSSWLINQRFGEKPRLYVKHNGHPMRRSVLKELRMAFPAAFEVSMAHKFRGEILALHMWFLYNHYVFHYFFIRSSANA